jgi:flagellar motor switch protein FliM
VAADNAVLSQREIDALINGDLVQDESREAAPAAAQPLKEVARRIKPYDFRHPEKLSKEQLRGLQLIQQAVASSLAASLGARLRSPVEAKLSALERSIYEEYVAQVGQSSVFVVIDMAPLNGYAIASFGVDVAFGIVDRLLGGRGRQVLHGLNRDLTDIEIALVRHIGGDIANSLVEPWARVAELTPSTTEIAVGSQVVHAVPGSEFVITAWYEIRYAEHAGGISLCFPLSILEQVLPNLTGQSLFEARRRGELQDSARVPDLQLMPMNVPVRAILGASRVPAADLANLATGDVIVLERTVETPLRVFVGNEERFAAFAGTRRNRLALQIAGLIDEDGRVQAFEGASA